MIRNGNPVGEERVPENPPSWQRLTLGDVCMALAGSGFPKALQGKLEGEFPFFKVGDISEAWQEGRSYLNRSYNYLSRDEARSLGAKPLPSNSTVFAKIGAAIALNRRAILSEPSLVDNNVMGLFPLPDVLNATLLFYFMRTVRLADASRATTVPSVRKSDVENIPFSLPPLPEQHRIVAEIEKQFTRLDASVESLKRARANLKRYRASVLKSACEGTLAPTEAELARAEGRDYEPADELLERILAERRARWESQETKRGKYKEPVAPDTSELPALPEGWVWATVGQLISRSEYGTSVKCDYGSVGPPILRIPNIAAGEIDLSDVKYSTQDLSIDNESALQPGDILMCRTNGSINLVGRTAVVRTKLEPLYGFASYLLRFRLLEYEPLPQWLHIHSNSRLGRAFVELHAASSAGQNNISLTLIHGMPIPLPPLAEQQRIVAEVERRLSVIQQSETAMVASLARAERLRQSILKQAFSGQLVPQDPSDEPASALLERIKAEREVAKEAEAPKARTRRARVGSSGRGKGARERQPTLPEAST